jgi:hypothetical protein
MIVYIFTPRICTPRACVISHDCSIVPRIRENNKLSGAPVWSRSECTVIVTVHVYCITLLTSNHCRFHSTRQYLDPSFCVALAALIFNRRGHIASNDDRIMINSEWVKFLLGLLSSFAVNSIFHMWELKQIAGNSAIILSMCSTTKIREYNYAFRAFHWSLFMSKIFCSRHFLWFCERRCRYQQIRNADDAMNWKRLARVAVT